MKLMTQPGRLVSFLLTCAYFILGGMLMYDLHIIGKSEVALIAAGGVVTSVIRDAIQRKIRANEGADRDL